jgi:rSAM/selenodomain-associated transferase 2/rSAM/selenodomain-associated transferase 1
MLAPLKRMPAEIVSLRIVMPVLNESDGLTEKLRALQGLRAQGAELVVVDGGSTDDSWARARPWVDRLFYSPSGRAAQMNAGAAEMPGSKPDALLFLHADTQLPDDAFAAIAQALQSHAWGRFDVQLNSKDACLRMVESLMNLRSRISGIATGDQAMFVRTEAFRALGGFPDQPLMEDIELSSRLLKISRPACLRQRVRTSARKWETGGVWRTILLMWHLRLAYFFGTKPTDLALAYGYRPRPPAAFADIAILAKAPVAGFAKTRLIPLLGAWGAARAQRQFTQQAISTAQQARTGAVTLWCAPDAEQRYFRAFKKQLGTACVAQASGDLGERMRRCAEHHFSSDDAPPLLIMGTDCPVLSPGRLQEAARSLIHHEACLIPAEDGGYVLLGLRKMVPEVFSNIEWSTPRVLSQTQERLAQAGTSVALLPTLWDIDEPHDWQRWQSMHTEKGAL